MPKRIFSSGKTSELGSKGVSYLLAKDEEKTAKGKIESLAKEIKALFPEVPMEANGKHKEITITLGDGATKILIRDQVAEKVALVDNHLDILRAKVGQETLDKFTVKQIVLHPNALENMVTQGLIDNGTIEAITTITETHSLIVKKA